MPEGSLSTAADQCAASKVRAKSLATSTRQPADWSWHRDTMLCLDTASLTGFIRSVAMARATADHTKLRWVEYKVFMNLYGIFKEFEARKIRPVTDETIIDAVTVPTELYDPGHTYKYGEDPDQDRER